MKGVLFVNRRYMTGVTKTVYKRVGWDLRVEPVRLAPPHRPPPTPPPPTTPLNSRHEAPEFVFYQEVSIIT